MHKLHETAGTIAALTDFAAIGIEDAVAEIGGRGAGCLHQQQLVKADACVAVSELLYLLRRQEHGLINSVNDDKVVAEAVHLGEFEHHGLQRQQVFVPVKICQCFTITDGMQLCAIDHDFCRAWSGVVIGAHGKTIGTRGAHCQQVAFFQCQ